VTDFEPSFREIKFEFHAPNIKSRIKSFSSFLDEMSTKFRILRQYITAQNMWEPYTLRYYRFHLRSLQFDFH